MKANELMIGDWVHSNHHGKNIKITQYDFFTHLHNECGEQELAPYAKPISGRDFEPIPITPEILKKNGFKGIMYGVFNVDNYQLQYYYKKNKLIIFHTRIEELKRQTITTEIIFQCRCFFIHQLQQVLRFCEIDKEIEL